jgi:hypothetical protein
VDLRLDLHVHLQVQIEPQLERLFLLSSAATAAEEPALLLLGLWGLLRLLLGNGRGRLL